MTNQSRPKDKGEEDNKSFEIENQSAPKDNSGKLKVNVTLTPNCVQLPLKSVFLTINCDPSAAPEYPYEYQLILKDSRQVTRDFKPETCEIDLEPLRLEEGAYEYEVIIKGKNAESRLEGLCKGKLNVYPGAT